MSTSWPSVQRVCICGRGSVCVSDCMHIECMSVLAGLCGWHEMIQTASSPKMKNKQTNSFAVGSSSAV